MLDYLIANKEWIFSGIGVSVLSWLIFIFRNPEKGGMSQNSGDNSTNIQVGGNVTSSFREEKNGD